MDLPSRGNYLQWAFSKLKENSISFDYERPSGHRLEILIDIEASKRSGSVDANFFYSDAWTLLQGADSVGDWIGFGRTSKPFFNLQIRNH